MSQEMDDESNPEIARQNALGNFQRLVSTLPESVQAKEAQLYSTITNLKGSPIKKLRHLHLALEELSDAIAPFLACRRGCNACCHYNVHVYPIEAELIEKRTGNIRSKGPHPQVDYTGTPCVFLKDGDCSIYEDRPMACRKHVALTNTSYWCQPDRSGSIELPMANFSKVEASFAHIVQVDGRTSISDLRQSFAEPL